MDLANLILHKARRRFYLGYWIKRDGGPREFEQRECTPEQVRGLTTADKAGTLAEYIAARRGEFGAKQSKR